MKEFAGVIGAKKLPADIVVPEPAHGVILFAHGSGSSRLSPRNRRVAAELNQAGFATALFDLLTDVEALDRRKVFDIALLGGRMSEAVSFAQTDKSLGFQRIGLFGASTGAAAAFYAAAEHAGKIGAIVSRGGRPDLALPVLKKVAAPTLLIVGGYDEPVIAMNRTALAALRCEKKLEVVPGATHLFDEPGALEQVIELAKRWFELHLLGSRMDGDGAPRQSAEM